MIGMYPSMRTCVDDTSGFEHADLPPEVVMILRIYALYNRSIKILIPLMTLLVVQIITSAVGTVTAGFGGCELPMIT